MYDGRYTVNSFLKTSTGPIAEGGLRHAQGDSRELRAWGFAERWTTFVESSRVVCCLRTVARQVLSKKQEILSAGLSMNTVI